MRWKNEDSLRKITGFTRLYGDERGNVKRTVLLLVLLLVLAAAAVLLLYPDLISPPEPEPAQTAANKVNRKVVQLPQKETTQPVAPAPVPEQSVQPQAQSPATEPAPKPATAETEVKATTLQPKAQPVEAKPTAETQPAQAKPATAAQPAEAKPAAETQPAKPAVEQTVTEPAAKPTPKTAPATAAGPKGPYTVTAGAYLLKESVDQADKLVRKLGYTPYHSKVTRDIEVVRLKEGTYSETEAQARVNQYKKEFDAEAFMLKGARGFTVYLGSYVGLDRARVHADRLYAMGVRVSEEKAVVPMSLTMVRFGDFNDQASASQAVTKAKAAGLEAYVSKVP